MDNEDMVCIYPGILVSPKKNEILSFVAIWMDQEIIVLNDVNQTENDKYNHSNRIQLKKIIEMNLFTKYK